MALGNSNKDNLNMNGLMQSIANTPASSFPIIDVEQLKTTVAMSVKEAIIKLLDERQRKREEKDKAEGRVSPEEYMSIIGEYYKKSVDNNGIFLKEYEKVREILKKDNEVFLSYNENVKKANSLMEAVKEKLGIGEYNTAKTLPTPKATKEIPLFLLRDLPWYYINKIYYSKIIRKFVIIVFTCIYMLTIGLTCFMAMDNAEMRNDCEKNSLIRIHLRRTENQQIIQTINYFDMLYSDKKAHQEEIDTLWKKVQELH